MSKNDHIGAKKGGHKGWGKATDDIRGNVLEENDPMYELIEEEDFFRVPEKIKKQSKEKNLQIPLPPIQIIVNDFLHEGSTEEALKSIQSYNLSLNALQHFVKRVISYALENHAYERELTSQLLCAMVLEKVLENEMPQLCFDLVLENILDIILDSPDAVLLVAKFIARAIADEIVPPSYLKTAKISEENKLGHQVLNEVQALLKERSFGQRAEHIWGVGDFSSVKKLKEEARLIFSEYVISEEKDDALQNLKDLGTPAFNFQVITQGLRLAIESQNSSHIQKTLDLIQFFEKVGAISQGEIQKGFKNCQTYLKDLALDVPTSQQDFEKIEKLAQEMKLI